MRAFWRISGIIHGGVLRVRSPNTLEREMREMMRNGNETEFYINQ